MEKHKLNVLVLHSNGFYLSKPKRVIFGQKTKQKRKMTRTDLNRRLSFLVFLLSRKACTVCGCSTVDHAPGNDLEDDQRIGRLLADSPCSHLTAKIKGGGGLRMYKRNRMIVTNPVVSRKDPTFNTTTYDWAPAGLNQKLVGFTVECRRLLLILFFFHSFI